MSVLLYFIWGGLGAVPNGVAGLCLRLPLRLARMPRGARRHGSLLRTRATMETPPTRSVRCEAEVSRP